MTRRTNPLGFSILVFASLVALAAASGARTRVDEAADHVLTGDITVVDRVANTITVRGEDGELTTLLVTDATALGDDARHIALDDLVKGDRVAVEWDDRTGRNVATYLEVVDEVGPR